MILVIKYIIINYRQKGETVELSNSFTPFRGDDT